MPMNEKDVRWVEEPRVGLWEASFLPAIVEGLRTTFRHVVDHKPTTQEFPEEKPALPQNYRGVHRLNRDEKGRVKCVACFMCATACPAHCISIEAAAAPDTEEWRDRDKFPASFVIDELKCIYCGMCEEACPCDAIELTNEFDISGLSREEMLFDREKLLSVYDETSKNPLDPPRTHRGALSGSSEIDVPPALPPTRPIGAPAVDALTSQPPAKPIDPTPVKLVPPGPAPGEPTHMHPPRPHRS